jgi:hypothetical protein
VAAACRWTLRGVRAYTGRALLPADGGMTMATKKKAKEKPAPKRRQLEYLCYS